jgi:hypothetical protein
MLRAHLVVGFTLALFSAACDEGGAVDHTETRGTTVSSCGAWRCGLNAAEINGKSLQSLHLQGTTNQGVANDAGVRISGFTAPPLALLGGYSLGVENDEFVARRTGSKLRGSQLAGSIIWVQTPLLLGLSAPIPVTILAYDEVDSWAVGAPKIAAYTLVYPEVAALLGVKNVCSGSLLDPLAAAVTVLGGETYDNAAKEVQANRTGWFTLACAGSAAAKMKLMGYAPQTKFPGTTTPSTVAQRQATLKMITADYCGEGVSYTETGTPVVWSNAAGTVDSSNWHAPDEVEAVWGEDGALCLGATRLADADVDCDLPTCDDLDVDDGEWITYTAAP